MAILTKLEDNYEGGHPYITKGQTRNGSYIQLPTIGQIFILQTSATKAFLTSFVQSIVETTEEFVVFTTDNSVYRLEF